MSDPWTIAALLVLAFAFFLVEVLVVPGVGVPGVLATVLAGASCYIAWMEHGPAVGAGIIVFSVASGTLVWWAVMRSRTARRLVLEHELPGWSSQKQAHTALVGREGVVQTPLRPGGMVSIDGQRHHAVADGGAWIDAGRTVRVVRAQASDLVVAPLLPAES